MGGPCKRTKPQSCEALMQNFELWELFEKEGYSPFFKAMKCFNDKLASKFVNSWQKGVVTIEGVCFRVTKDLIVKATRLRCEGKQIEKKRNENYERFIDAFLEKGEKLVKFQNDYNRDRLPAPWGLVSIHVMKHFTLEGYFQTINGYHFLILNHIRHGSKINMSFYLLSFLQK